MMTRMVAALHTLHIEGDRVLVPKTAFDHPGFRAWATSDDFPEGIRAAYVQGEIFIEMSPESLESHNKPSRR